MSTPDPCCPKCGHTKFMTRQKVIKATSYYLLCCAGCGAIIAIVPPKQR